jgi:Domain of Unknown Function with PDB structure (DUF3857)/Transglutaminase-like superfamily
MRLLLLVFAILLCSGAAARSAEGDIRFAAAPDWARLSAPLAVPDDVRGTLFIRRQDFGSHLDGAGNTYFVASLIRLVHPNSLQLGNISFSWNPAAGKPVVHAIKVHRNGSVRDVIATTKFEILRREDQLEAATLDGMMTATLRVPDLRVGDDLEVAYSIPGQDPTLGKDSFGTMYLTETPPPGRYSLRLSWDEGQEPSFKSTADIAQQMVRGPREVSLSADMPGSVKMPKFAPPRYAWRRVIQFSDFSSWQSLSSRFAPLFRKSATLAPNSTVREEAAEIAAANATSRERAAAALKLVQQQVRYVYVGFNGGNYTPANADETWQRRYGDCKGKTALLLALLNELGIPAEAVLVSNAQLDDGLDQRLPSPAFFDHVLVRAKIDGQTYWLDGTMPPVAVPTPEPIIPYRWVLPLSDAGTTIERLEWKPARRPDTIALFEFDARAGFIQPAKRHTTLITRGPGAFVAYNQFSGLTDEELLSAFKREMEGTEDWITIDRVTWRFDSRTLASILEISGTTKLEWDTEGRNSRSLLFPSAGYSQPYRRQRSVEEDQTVPYYKEPEYLCRVTTVRLPADTAPKDWSFNSSYFVTYFGQTFLRSIERRDGAIRMVSSNRTLQTELDPQSAARDNERIAKFDNSKGQIFYDPGSSDLRKPADTVPATYEIDWLTDDSACLAAKPSIRKP